jgi:hypothetical protein
VRGRGVALRTRQISDVAHYLLVYRVALLADGFLDYVALLEPPETADDRGE